MGNEACFSYYLYFVFVFELRVEHTSSYEAATSTPLLWPMQVGSWSEVAQTTIKWRRNGRRFVHTTAQPYRPPLRPFRYHPGAVRSLLKPVETAGGC